MVDKRTLAFLTLAILVWAISTSSLAGYYHLQNMIYSTQIDENQQVLDKTASDYNESMSRYNALTGAYSTLYGNYSFAGIDLTPLMEELGTLIDSLKGNFSSLLTSQKDLNETYFMLKKDYQLVYDEHNVTREDFGGLLNEFYNLFTLLVIRDVSMALGETVTLTVSLCIDYGNDTVNWHNETKTSAGSSLFQLTQEVAKVNYTYYPLMKPGHVLVDSINDKKAYTADYSEGWSWIWFYWNNKEQRWVSGPVGCDAWMIKDSGTYKWKFEHWSWP